jgi:organic radical activating enzyme
MIEYNSFNRLFKAVSAVFIKFYEKTKTIWSTLSGTKPIIEKNLKESAEKDKKKEDEKFTKRMKAVAKDAEAKENKEAAERKTAEQQADAVELQKLEGIGTIDAITKRKEIEDRMKKRAEEINNLTKKARTAEKEAERARNTIEVTATATVEGGGGGAKKEEGH